MTLMQQLAKKTRERRPQPAPYKGPDKASANGNRPLTFPTPYHGGKRRWAEQILDAFGDERECVYVEPFSGSAAVLLANPRPFAREILCDTNPHISNVFRCLAWAPETTAFWADWPTTHQDLTARHTWLLRWAVDHVADIEADPDFHDPKAAGWWLWGKSNWIGTEFAIVRGLQTGGEPDMADATRISTSRPHVGIGGHGMGTGMGVQVGRDKLPVEPQVLPTPSGKRPSLQAKNGGQGISAQRYDAGMPTPRDSRPHVQPFMSGQGVQPQRTGLPQSSADVRIDNSRPAVTDGMRGSGVSAMRRTPLPQSSADVPYMPEHGGGRGVNAQRKQARPDSGGRDAGQAEPSAKIPFVRGDSYGRGVSAQRTALPTAPDKRPLIGKGDDGGAGVQVQRTQVPHAGSTGAAGVSAQRHDDLLPTAPPDKIPHIAQNGGGIGVAAQREGIADDGPPDATHGARGAIGRARQARQSAPPTTQEKIPHVEKTMGGTGIQVQRDADMSSGPPPPRSPHESTEQYKKRQVQESAYEMAGPVPLTGDRLRPWFQALAQRLYRVIILNRGWQSGLTPTVLQQTRTARKPPVRVLIDPPYKGVGKLYGMSEDEADSLAVASWRWAAENGSREGWRIAYACREGDFDDEALALGWTCSKTNITANHWDSTQEVIWFSPHCLRPGQPRQQEPGEQGRMFETGE